MIILGIESSCDETAAAVTDGGRRVLADEIYSQADMHKLYGGVVPEIASRKHMEVVDLLARNALDKAGVTAGDLDAIAVTYAPGLIGALLVGVNFAKSLALTLGVPVVPVHHIRGHVAACYIAYPLEPPFIALVVSGGHSLIIDVRGYTDMRVVGTTRDDAAGECFDKVARSLGLGYPGGRALDELACGGDENLYTLPRSRIEGSPFDMSFSGLKTAVINLIHNAEQKGTAINLPSLAASFCKAVSDSLVPRTVEAALSLGYDTICLGGGVAANSVIRRDFAAAAKRCSLRLCPAPLPLCADNGAMIACQGFYELMAGNTAGAALNGFATLPVDYKAGI